MNQTQKLVFSMLMENTGVAMSDSGGDNGRNWQRNAKNDPSKQPEVVLDIPRLTFQLEHNGQFIRRADKRTDLMAYKGLSATEMDAEGYVIKEFKPMSDDIGITVSLYHYLPQVLELDEICEAFNSNPANTKEWNSDVYGVSQHGLNWLNREGFTWGDSWNTYNGEQNISQTLQGTELKKDGSGEGDYVLLQIHGGADVRGGYTDAKLFKYKKFQEYINPCPDVWGQIKRGDETISLQMRENGYGFELENPETGYGGAPVELLPTDIIEAGIIER